MASELSPASLYILTIRRATAAMECKLNRDFAKQAELERIYQDLLDEETAAKVTLRLMRANNNSLKDFK